MNRMLSNSMNYLAVASIIRLSRLVSPYASKERIPHVNSTGSALPVSGVAHETSNQTAKPKLLNQVRIVLRSRYNNQRTESAYLNWIKRFILFHNKRHPAEMAETEVNQFLTHLAINEKVSASTQNQTLSALLFRYRHVLDLKPGQLGAVIRARKSKLRNQIRQRAVFQDAIGAMTNRLPERGRSFM